MIRSVPTCEAIKSSSGASIHRLKLQAFPNFWANAYLVQTGGQRILIDTGSGADLSNVGLVENFEQIGVQFSDLTHILLTHGHIDHYGGLGYLREHTTAEFGVHELDLGTVTAHEARLSILSNKLDGFLLQAGIEPERRAELLAMYRFTKKFHHSVPVDFTYEARNMQVGPLDILHVPGHCPGHVALKLDNIVFCGDLVLEKVTPHQSPEDLLPFMGVRHYLDSLSVFEEWAGEVSMILNGHDDPITDLSKQIASVRTNLSRRINQTLDALSDPSTLAEVTSQVYGDLNGYNALLVLEKIGAYVEYLSQSGMVEIANADELEKDPLAVLRVCRRNL